jgi:hypothetical protein
LASGSGRAVPFRAVQEDNRRFVDKKYIPADVIIKEAKNMQKDDLIHFLEHVLDRQQRFGADDAFRFRIFIKKQTEHLSKYPASQPGERPINKSKRPSKPRAKKKNKTPIQDQISDEAPNDINLQNDTDMHHGPKVIADSAIDPIILEISQKMLSSRVNPDYQSQVRITTNTVAKDVTVSNDAAAVIPTPKNPPNELPVASSSNHVQNSMAQDKSSTPATTKTHATVTTALSTPRRKSERNMKKQRNDEVNGYLRSGKRRR